MPLRILIADDNSSIRRRLRRFLESQPDLVVCDEAKDGREAVEKVKQLSPDVVILDVAMPVMNGLGAAEKISTLAPDLPIIVYTMYATPQIEREVQKRGVKAVVPKTDGNRLISVVRRLVPQDQAA